MTLGYKERYFAVIPKANTFFLIVQGAVGDVYCKLSLQGEFTLGGDF
jgi:hypothetical protein